MASQMTTPLTLEDINRLGCELFPLVLAMTNSESLTGKIVGMLLEVPFNPSHNNLREKVIEAIVIIKSFPVAHDPRSEELIVLANHVFSKLVSEPAKTASLLPAPAKSTTILPDDSCGLYAFGRSCTGGCQKKHNARYVSTDKRKKIVCKFFPRCGNTDCTFSHEWTIVFEDFPVDDVKTPMPPPVDDAKIPEPPVDDAKIPEHPVAKANGPKGYIRFCFIHFSNSKKGCKCENKDGPEHDALEFVRVGAKDPNLYETVTKYLQYKRLTIIVPDVQDDADPAPVRAPRDPAPVRVPRPPAPVRAPRDPAPVRPPREPVAAGGGGGFADRPAYCFAGLSAGQCFIRGCTGCHDRIRFDLDCARSTGLRNAFKNYENGVKKKAART